VSIEEMTPLPAVDSEFIRETRKRMRCSRAVFARKLRINERTLEKWEQGRAKPNPQAAALVLLVRRYSDTLERLDKGGGRLMRWCPLAVANRGGWIELSLEKFAGR
jgi:putative transcriptional regulator